MAPARGVLRRWVGVALGALSGAGYVLLAFSLLWGLNYRRPPLGTRLGIPSGGTAADLVATARWLARESARLAPAGPAGRPTRLPYRRRDLDARIEAAYTPTAAGRLVLEGRLGPAKPVLLSEVLSRLGLSGIYSPFTGEPNYNRLLPAAELPFAIAHEKAHQRGVAPENEANFAAFLALHAADDPYLRYAGFLNALAYVLGPVARTDPVAYQEIAGLIEGRPAADLEAMRVFWRRYRGPAQRVSRRVNDLYLRANRVPGGIRSYGAVTDLLVGWHRRRRGV